MNFLKLLCTYIYAYLNTHTCMCAHTCSHAHINMSTLSTHVCEHAYACMQITCAHIYIYRTYVCVCIPPFCNVLRHLSLCVSTLWLITLTNDHKPAFKTTDLSSNCSGGQKSGQVSAGSGSLQKLRGFSRFWGLLSCGLITSISAFLRTLPPLLPVSGDSVPLSLEHLGWHWGPTWTIWDNLCISKP